MERAEARVVMGEKIMVETGELLMETRAEARGVIMVVVGESIVTMVEGRKLVVAMLMEEAIPQENGTAENRVHPAFLRVTGATSVI